MRSSPVITSSSRESQRFQHHWRKPLGGIPVRAGQRCLVGTRVPGLDKALLELFAIFSVIIITGLVVTISSIVGVIRAIRRRRRGGRAVAAVVLAAIATAITVSWLFFWVGDDIYHRSNPIDALLEINLLISQRIPGGWTIHDLRHTCLSNLALEGMPLHAIKEYAGHKNITETQRYLKYMPQQIELGAKVSTKLAVLANA